jgi:membrane-associated protease RseP (regulator of RpoE activity)
MRRVIRQLALMCAIHAYASSASAQAGAPAAPSAERVTLGIAVAEAGAPPCAEPAVNLPAVCVLSFLPGSAAQRAGVRAGDLIRRFGPSAIATPTELIDAVVAAKVGQRVDVVLERNGERVELQVEFTPADVRGPPASAPVVPAPVVDLCAGPAAGEPRRGPWQPPYERLPLPVDAGELLALVDDTDTAVVAEGGVLSIVRRDARDALNVTGTFQCPMSQISDHVWALQLRMANW